MAIDRSYIKKGAFLTGDMHPGDFVQRGDKPLPPPSRESAAAMRKADAVGDRLADIKRNQAFFIAEIARRLDLVRAQLDALPARKGSKK